MLKEIIKENQQIENAEGRNFGISINSINLSLDSFSTLKILTQNSRNFTDFLAFECVICKSSFGRKKSVRYKTAWACEECFRTLQESIKQAITDMKSQPRKVVRLYRCFGCDKNFAARKMSKRLAICRNSFKVTQDCNNQKRNRLVTKTLSKFGAFLRGKI